MKMLNDEIRERREKYLKDNPASLENPPMAQVEDWLKQLQLDGPYVEHREQARLGKVALINKTDFIRDYISRLSD